MTHEAPTVLAIGSCRVFRPLRRMHEQGAINLVNYGPQVWFNHSSAGARQFVEVMSGKFVIPPDLRQAALETEFEWEEDMALGLPRVDVVAVEVSSLKTHSVGETILNAHKVYGSAKEAGVDPSPVAQGATAELPKEHPLKSLEVTYTTHSQLQTDLVAIREATRAPVFTVDHLYSLTPEGVPAPERIRLTEELRAIEGENGIPLHSTKELILKYGFEAVLLDHNHYREDFEVVAGRDLMTTISRIHATKQGETSVHP